MLKVKVCVREGYGCVGACVCLCARECWVHVSTEYVYERGMCVRECVYVSLFLQGRRGFDFDAEGVWERGVGVCECLSVCLSRARGVLMLILKVCVGVTCVGGV